MSSLFPEVEFPVVPTAEVELPSSATTATALVSIDAQMQETEALQNEKTLGLATLALITLSVVLFMMNLSTFAALSTLFTVAIGILYSVVRSENKDLNTASRKLKQGVKRNFDLMHGHTVAKGQEGVLSQKTLLADARNNLKAAQQEKK